ncbi:glycosyltransferase family 9 protein [bacterium]|nr:glycosyltransferase family 9 protein [bacterium]
MPKRALIVSLQGIGNNLLALPLAASLRLAGYERVEMLVTSPRAATLLTTHPAVDDTLASNAASFAGLKGRGRLVAELRRRRYDTAVLAYPSGEKSILLTALADIPVRIGLAHWTLGAAQRLLTHSEPADHGLHDLEHNAALARLAGASTDMNAHWPPFLPSHGAVNNARRFLRDNGFDPAARYVGMHPGSDGHFIEKRWPEYHLARFAERMHRTRGLATIVFDGPSERGAGRRIANLAATPVLPMDGWGDLADALGLLAFCDLFVSNDSGLMNLAAASGVPTVAVFGPSVVSRTRPWGPRRTAVVAERPCVPCYDLGPYSGCVHPTRMCLADLSPERVALAVDDVLGA